MQGKLNSDVSSERQRRWHAKVTSGCFTCRRRRVKCDEQRPVCKSCLRLKLTCHGNGYGPDASTTNATKDRNIVSGFHVITPDSYGRRESSDSLSDQSSSSSSTSNSSEPTHTALQKRQFCRTSAATRLPSIYSILSAARYDPFNTGRVTDASIADRRNFDHAIFCQWPNLTTDLKVIQSEIMTYALNDPVVWYTIIFAGSSHHAFWANQDTYDPQRDLTRRAAKARAIQTLLQALQDRNGETTDEILISMLILSAHGTGESVRRDTPSKVQSRKTMLRIMDSEYYGALDPGVEHLQILYKFIQRRGGIQMIRSRTVTMATIFFDIWNSFKLLSRPGLPITQPLSEVLTLRTWASDSEGDQLYRRLTRSLNPIMAALDLAEYTTLLSLAEGFRILTTDMNQIRRTPKADSVLSAPDQSRLIMIRGAVIHTLLNLPDYAAAALGLVHSSDPVDFLIYELCRVSFLMYAQVWLFPIVNKKRNLPRGLLSKMWPLLSASTSRLFGGATLSIQHPNLFLWAVGMCLLCAYEDFDVTGDSTSMQKVALFIRHTQIEPLAEYWPKVVDILEMFLWSGQDCDLTGQEAWQQACFLLSVSKQASLHPPIAIRGCGSGTNVGDKVRAG